MTQENPQQAFFGVMEKVPSPVYYWAGIAAILGSLALMLQGKKQEALFVGQWPPTFFILAVLYKQVRPSRES
jgi:hypothetical protein